MRWPLSRVARYCGTFVLGLIVGGSAVRLGGHPVPTQSTVDPNHKCQALSSRGQQSEAIEPTIQAHFAKLVSAILTIKSAINTSARQNQFQAVEQSSLIPEVEAPGSCSATANRGMVVTETDPRPDDHNSLLLVGPARQ